MIYKVKARVIDDAIGEFYRKLADGTVAKQRPDGPDEFGIGLVITVTVALIILLWVRKRSTTANGGFVAETGFKKAVPS